VDGITALLDGFSVAARPEYLLLALLGAALGTAIGVLPGIGPAMTVALLLPLTATVDAQGSLILFAGIYYGAMYGGSTTSILLNTPGEAASVITAVEGNQMARAGRGPQALATAAIGSFVAGLVATLALALAAPTVADLAVRLTSADHLALFVLAFVTVSTVLGASRLRGLASLGLGLALGLVGIDAITGQDRYTAGSTALLPGIDVVTAAIALFAIGEALHVAARPHHEAPDVADLPGSWWARSLLSRDDLSRSWRPWLRGTAIGFPLGVLPAGGATIPTFLSYAAEKRLSRRPQEFGHGAIEGVAGPEAANNAAAAGTLVPLLTLGLPTSAVAAVILTAFTQYGIRPGPQLFDTQPRLVWSLIASLLIGNLMLLALNLPLAGLWTRLLRVPRPYLYAGILTFAMLGAYTAAGTTSELAILIGLGVLGLTMRRFEYPVAPTIIGLILGPLAEEQTRRTLTINNGDPTALITSWPAATVYTLTALLVLAPAAGRLRAKRRLALGR
jgi:putative tricarboxylic transport membrane protein